VAGIIEVPPFLNIEWLLAGLGRRKKIAIERYREFITQGEGFPSIWASLRNQVLIGSEVFVETAQSRMDNDRKLSEVSSYQLRPLVKSLDEYTENSAERNAFIVKAYVSGGYTLKDIDRVLSEFIKLNDERSYQKS